MERKKISKNSPKKKSIIIESTKISKIHWDNSYGEQIPMRALSDTGHPIEGDY